MAPPPLAPPVTPPRTPPLSAARAAAATGGVIGYFTRHRTAANLLLVLLVVAGLAAAPQMRAQYFPDVVFDNIDVTVAWPDAGPEEVDRAVVAPLLAALSAVEGVEQNEATAREGRGQVNLEFEPGWDMARAQADVETALSQLTDLPEEAEVPSVRRRAWNDRVTDVVLTGPVGVDQLARFADDFVLRLYEAGVTRTTLRGIADPLVTVEVATRDLIRHDLTLAEIAAAIAAAAATDPAGSVDAANARLRSGTARNSAAEIAAIPLRPGRAGGRLTVGDVARIETGGVDRERAYFVGRNPALSIRVDRSDRGDAIDIQARVQEAATELQDGLPPGVTVDLIRARSEEISARLALLLDNGLMGLGLVVGLLFLFLNARTAFWVAAGIPVAMCAAVAIMFALGVSLNMISLFGLIITLGIVVDDAIVVGEHADYRARTLGEPPVIAAETAARRMALPVFSATLTTIIAFWALTVIGGRYGTLIRDIPVTVVAVLAASLVECFLILPNHMSHALAHSRDRHWYDWPSRQVNRGFDWLRERAFRPAIRLILAARWPVLAAAFLVLSSQVVLFVSGDVTWRFFNAPERPSISGNFAMAPGATRADSLEQMQELQRAAEAVAARFEAEHGRNPLAYVLAEIGGNTGRGLSGADDKGPDQLGSIAIELIDPDLRPYSSFAFLGALQDEVVNHPLAETVSFRGWRSGPGGDALSVELSGAAAQTLKAAAEALKRDLAAFPVVSAVEDSMPYDKAELLLDLTPQGERLGFTIDEVGRALRQRLDGIEAASFPAGPREGSIRVEVPDAEKTADFLDAALIRAPSGQYLPLADLVTVTRQTGFSLIVREGGLRVLSVSGDISEDDPVAAAAVTEVLRDTILPRLAAEYQVGTSLAGMAEEERSFLADATTGLILCLLGIYLVLAWIFASWSRPLAIMAIIPFGLVGAVWGHYVWDVPLSMFSIVGLLGMTGIIVNDSIVLITTIDEYAADRGLRPAIVDAVCDRLRPVLLTTLTTVLGLAPLLYESSQQAQFLKPTVITLVYGLGFGMILVLLVVPALLAIGQDAGQAMRAGRRGLARGARQPRAGGIVGAASLGLALALAAWFAATLGAVLVAGASPVLALAPLAAAPVGVGTSAAFLVFAAGAILLWLAAWAIAAALTAARRPPGPQPPLDLAPPAP